MVKIEELFQDAHQKNGNSVDPSTSHEGAGDAPTTPEVPADEGTSSTSPPMQIHNQDAARLERADKVHRFTAIDRQH